MRHASVDTGMLAFRRFARSKCLLAREKLTHKRVYSYLTRPAGMGSDERGNLNLLAHRVRDDSRQPFCEKRANRIDQLFGSLGLRHVAITAGRSRLFLVSFHGK